MDGNGRWATQRGLDRTFADKKSIRVTLGKTVLDDDDYEIVGCTNNVRAGKATITLKGKGNYGGTVTAAFNITPMKTRRY